jgi:hypothetical protein
MKLNDFVINEKLPAWGVGKVLENKGEGKLRVYFEFAGEKIMLASFLSLTETPANSAPWDVKAQKKNQRKPRTIAAERTQKAKGEGARSRSEPKKVRLPASAARSFADLENRFLGAFPAGFKDSGYIATMRTPLQQTAQYFKERLSKESMGMLLETGHFRELSIAALRAVEETSFVPPQEQLALKDAMQRDKVGREAFGRALLELLYGEGELETRFDAFVEVLHELESLSWSMATYFLFLLNPWKYPFIKPQYMQAAARVYGVEAAYAVRPNWRSYEGAMRFLEHVTADLAKHDKLRPFDAFDTHCFLWKGVTG